MPPTRHSRAGGNPAATARARAGFTLIELLVVISIIAILVAVIGIVGTQIMGAQRSNYTRNIMRSAKLAIDQFAEVNPLRDIYNRPRAATFGPYPPYQLAGRFLPGEVRGAVEPAGALWPGAYTLQNRLRRDLAIPGAAPVVLADDGRNDDIRALYAYLAAFAPGTLTQVPDDAKQPLVTHLATGEYFNTAAGDPGDSRVPVLGLHDAWGVPLDYLLYARLEYTLLPGQSPPGWRVAEWMPVLRSRGITREQYDLALREPTDTAINDMLRQFEDSALWSDTMPLPLASVNSADGRMIGVGRTSAGWVRVRAGWQQGNRGEEYGYIP